MNDILIESLRSLVIGALLLLMWHKGKKESLHTLNGWRDILIGVTLILFGSILDITDNFDELNRFVIIGDTHTEAFLEKVVGYLGGYLYLAIGFWRWIPLAGKLDKEQHFRSLVEDSADWIWEVDTQGRYIYTSQRIFDLLGYTPEEVRGRTPFDFMPPGEAERIAAIFQEIASTRRPFSNLENINLHKNGHQVILETSGRPIYDRAGNYIGYQGIDRNITERKLAAQAAARRAHQLSALLNINREFSATLDLKTVLELTTLRITELADSGTSAIYFREADNLRLTATTPALPPDFPEPLRHSNLADHPTIRRAIESGQPIFLPDARNAELSAAERQTVEARDLRSVLYLPLLMGKEVSGVLIVATIGEHVTLSSSDLEICNNFAALAALAIANAKLYGQSQRDAAELKRNYSFTESVLKNASMGIHMYRLEPDGRLVFTGANPASARILQVDSSQFVNLTIEEAFPALAQTEIPERYRQIARDGGDWSSDQIIYDMGSIISSFRIKAFQTSPGQMAVFFEDITQAKRQEQALLASEERFDLAMSAANDGLWDWNMQTHAVYFSPRWKAMLGYANDELGNSFSVWEQLVDDEGQAKTKALINDCSAGKAEGFSVELRMRHKEGHWVDILSRAMLIRDEIGHAIRMIGTHVDISKQKLIERELKQRDRYQRAVLDNFPFLVWLKDGDSRFLAVNRPFAEMCQRDSAEELTGLTDLDIWPHDLAESYRTDDREVISSGRSKQVEEIIETPEGRRWFETYKSPIELDGSFIGTVGFARDITERKMNEEELYRYRTELEHLVEQRTVDLQVVHQRLADTQFAMDEAGIGIHWVDAATGQFLFVNRFAAELLGYSTEEMLKLNVMDIDPRVNQERFSAISQDLKNRGHLKFESIQKTRGGKLVPVEVSVYYLKGSKAMADRLVAFITDITLRKQAELRNQQLLSILDKSPDFISTATMEGAIEYLNPAGFRMVGMSENIDLKQKHIPDFHPEWACQKVIQEGVPATLSRGSWQGEIALLHQDGHEIPALQTILVHTDPQGKPNYLSNIIRDITKQKADEQALIDAKLTAEAASHAKSAFLANMSHEIRTPMSGVIGMTDVLLNTHLSPEQTRIARIIHDAANTQLGILNDILDFSKIEAGKMEISIEPFSLADTIAKTCASLDGAASQKHVHISSRIAPDIPPALAGDALRLRQIVSNFLSNAIKFSGGQGRPGQVELSAQLAAEEADQVWVEISVSDNGIGMDAPTLERIFHPFSQADSSTTKRYGGTGLGLVICMRLGEMMGGKIEVASEPGSGSKFTIRLPFAKADVSQLAAATDTGSLPPAEALTMPDGKPIHILVAEDNPTNQEVILQQLHMLGYLADIAGDGREAFARWLNNGYSLIISDIHMPHMDGYQLTEAIRAEEGKRGSGHIPIIALTANVLKGEAERCKKAGMDEYLPKPIPLSQLRNCLAKWLTVAAPAQPNKPTHPESLPEQLAELPVFDADMLTRMVGSNPALHRRLLEKFLTTTQAHAEHLHAALTGQDIATVGQIAHALKSSARAVGAMQLGQLCEKLEHAGKAGDHAALAALQSMFDTVLDTAIQAIRTSLQDN